MLENTNTGNFSFKVQTIKHLSNVHRCVIHSVMSNTPLKYKLINKTLSYFLKYLRFKWFVSSYYLRKHLLIHTTSNRCLWFLDGISTAVQSVDTFENTAVFTVPQLTHFVELFIVSRGVDLMQCNFLQNIKRERLNKTNFNILIDNNLFFNSPLY